MVNYYVKGGSDYLNANCKLYFYLDLSGYPEGDYETRDDSHIQDEDPYIHLSGVAGGAKTVVIGLSGDYRIEIDDTNGIRGWDEVNSQWVNLLTGDLNDLGDVNAGAPNDNDVLAWDDGTSKWIPVPAVVGGETNTASNVGTDGLGVFKQKAGVDLEFKHIAPASAKITVVANGDDIDIDAVPSEIYTNAEAVSAVATADDYIKNDAPDTLGGDLSTDVHDIILSADEASISLHDGLSADNKWSGIIATMQVDVNTQGFGGLLHMDTDGNFIDADANVEASLPCTGMALGTTGAIKVMFHGFVRDDAWNWTPGQLLFVSATAGDITATKPTTTGHFVQCVGFAVSADVMFFNPQYEYFELS